MAATSSTISKSLTAPPGKIAAKKPKSLLHKIQERLGLESSRHAAQKIDFKGFETSDSPLLVVYFLGPFRVYFNDAPVENWTGNISKSIFKYMVLHRKRQIATEVLMDTFWPEAEPESARRNLYQAIYQVRQAFQPNDLDIPIILSSNGSYGINSGISIWLDYEEFIRQYENGRHMFNQGDQQAGTAAYEAADSLHDGDFLAEELYEDWTIQKRAHLRRTHLAILEELSHFYLERERWASCISHAQKLLGEDNCNEGAHRVLMRAYYRQGQRHLALKQYFHCREVLQEELDTEPMPETAKLSSKYGRIKFIFPVPKN